ncbi:MAG: histidine kinase [Candidatus Cloacimonetes bacterium]|nr:histidine kinase [Candidatus Cloacimonadota bacterium]
MEAIHIDNPEKLMYNWWSKVRWFIVIVLFAIGILRANQTLQTYPSMILVVTFLGISILNVLYHFQILFPSSAMGAVQIVLDIIFATLVVHLTGGLQSDFVWIYLIAIITASITIEKMGGFISAMIGSMCMLFLLITYNYGWLIPVNGSQSIDVPSQTIFLLSYTALFSGIAFIASFISNILKKLSQQNKKIREELADVEKNFDIKKQEIEQNISDISKYRDVVKVGARLASLDHDINNPLTIISLSLRRLKKAAQEYKDDKLSKSAAQMEEAINNINGILVRLQDLKRLDLIKEERNKLQG